MHFPLFVKGIIVMMAQQSFLKNGSTVQILARIWLQLLMSMFHMFINLA